VSAPPRPWPAPRRRARVPPPLRAPRAPAQPRTTPSRPPAAARPPDALASSAACPVDAAPSGKVVGVLPFLAPSRLPPRPLGPPVGELPRHSALVLVPVVRAAAPSRRTRPGTVPCCHFAGSSVALAPLLPRVGPRRRRRRPLPSPLALAVWRFLRLGVCVVASPSPPPPRASRPAAPGLGPLVLALGSPPRTGASCQLPAALQRLLKLFAPCFALPDSHAHTILLGLSVVCRPRAPNVPRRATHPGTRGSACMHALPAPARQCCPCKHPSPQLGPLRRLARACPAPRARAVLSAASSQVAPPRPSLPAPPRRSSCRCCPLASPSSCPPAPACPLASHLKSARPSPPACLTSQAVRLPQPALKHRTSQPPRPPASCCPLTAAPSAQLPSRCALVPAVSPLRPARHSPSLPPRQLASLLSSPPSVSQPPHLCRPLPPIVQGGSGVVGLWWACMQQRQR
jgi:hypothetical protein